MNRTTRHSAVPSAVLHKLQLLRQRKLFVQVAAAAVAAVTVLLAGMAIAMLIDWLATLYDSQWRYLLTISALTAAVLTGIGWLLLARRRWLSIDRIARDVDGHFPQLAERWTTVTRLAPDDVADPQVVHPAVLRRVAEEATSWEPHVEPEYIVSLSPLTRTMLCLTAVAAALCVAAVLNWQHTFVLMCRFWLPGSSISATQLVNVPGSVVVGRGEPPELAASIAGVPVERAVLTLRSADNAAKSISLVSHNTEPLAFAHRVRAVDEPFAYRFRAGDGQTEWYSVDVADRPEIADVQLTVTPPAYTKQAAKTFDKLPNRVAALEHSQLELKLQPTIPVERVELRLGNDHRVALTANEARWYTWTTELTTGFTLSPALTESHGLTNRRAPTCEFSVYKDKPPAVKVVTPDDTLAVQPDDTVEITFTASDDVGIGAAELLVYDESAAVAGEQPVPIATIPIPLGEHAGARSVQQTVALDLAKFTVEDGSELSYEIRVREDRGSASNSIPQLPPNQQPTVNTLVQQQAGGESQSDQRMEGNSPANTTSFPSSPAQNSTASNSSGATPSAASSAAEPSTGTDSMAQNAATSANAAQRKSGDRTASDKAPAAAPHGRAPETSQTTDAPQKAIANSQQALANNAPAAEHNQTKPADDAAATKPAADVQAAANAPPSTENTRSNSTSPPDDASQVASKAAASPPAQPKSTADNTKNTAGATQSASRPANQVPSESTQQRPQPPQQNRPQGDAARTASTGRHSLSNESTEQPSSAEPSSAATSAAGADNRASASRGDLPPGDALARRALDVPQTASSSRMRLTVDQWAGSFESQQRAKLEMAISPELDALDNALETAQQTSRGVLDELAANKEWRGTHDRDVATAERHAEEAQKIVSSVEKRSKGTPYAFVGLQLSNISQAHIEPARTNFWKALESAGDDRITSVRDGAQHLARARELVAELRGQYERARREFQLAESVERVKNMYQVYLENSQALLQMQDSDPTRYNRKMAEFELDDEYLKRLHEVLEMRRDLRSELARILAEDPRLLRRFMDSLRNRSNNLREELARLSSDQSDLNREVRAWSQVEEDDRPRVAKLLQLRHVQDATKLASAAGELQSRYQTWLPLDRESNDDALASATRTMQAMATAASELGAGAQRFVADAQRVANAASDSSANKPAVETPQPSQQPSAEAGQNSPASDSEKPSSSEPAAARPPSLDDLATNAQTLYAELNKLEGTLRQLAAREQKADAAAFAGKRLVETRRLIADSSAWVRQLRAHKEGNYTGAAEVEQYRLAMKSEELAGKLGSIEQTMADLMQRSDGTLPQPIAEKTREFIAALDKKVSPNQLAATYALRNQQLPRATERQKLAATALADAERAYDDAMRLAIAELDKLPVQDPVADLLDDPTLDELLAQLEQELPIEELLGIPQRPSNLRIVDDWLRPGSGNGMAGGGQMAMNQLRQQEELARQRLNRVYQRAIARALRESVPKTKVEIPQPAKLSDWNQLVSKLGDDLRQGRDKAPPEQYRRAIEQYFTQISRVVEESEREPK